MLYSCLELDTDFAIVKYVALLALEKIVKSHPDLILLHQDVILDCIDDGDISIRMRTLDLIKYMVNTENLADLVGRLLRQLRNSPVSTAADNPLNGSGPANGVEPLGESDDEEMEESLRHAEKRSEQAPPLPEPYRIGIIRRIIETCSRDTYANITDFEWYIDVLVQLVRVCPPDSSSRRNSVSADGHDHSEEEVSHLIGYELRNVAVRVRGVRPEAARAAESLISLENRSKMFPSAGNAGQGVLAPAAWIVGEFASHLIDPDAALTSLLQALSDPLPADVLATYLHAVLKLFVRLTGDQQISWTKQRKAQIVLLMARIVHALEPLTSHPDLDVQERAVEYVELMKLTSESASNQECGDEHGEFVDPPLLLTQAIPSLFMGMELNPVAAGAQHRIPVPDELDLTTPLNDSLQTLLQHADELPDLLADDNEFSTFYNEPPTASKTAMSYLEPAANRLDVPETEEISSYQQATENEYLDPDILARRRAERRERQKDDPFYIPSDTSGPVTPLHNIIRNTNGEELDVDSIPIMDLDLGSAPSAGARSPARATSPHKHASARLRPKKNFAITADESPDFSTSPEPQSGLAARKAQTKGKKSLLQVDSSALGSLSLNDDGYGSGQPLDIEQQRAEEAELRRIEAMRLEIQRSQVRIHAKDGDEGTLVKRKKKKKTAEAGEAGEAEGGETVVKKKKKKVKPKSEGVGDEGEGAEVVKPKVRKKKRVEAVVDV